MLNTREDGTPMDARAARMTINDIKATMVKYEDLSCGTDSTGVSRYWTHTFISGTSTGQHRPLQTGDKLCDTVVVCVRSGDLFLPPPFGIKHTVAHPRILLEQRDSVVRALALRRDVSRALLLKLYKQAASPSLRRLCKRRLFALCKPGVVSCEGLPTLSLAPAPVAKVTKDVARSHGWRVVIFQPR
jgi:hypothetical protein